MAMAMAMVVAMVMAKALAKAKAIFFKILRILRIGCSMVESLSGPQECVLHLFRVPYLHFDKEVRKLITVEQFSRGS